MFTNWLTGTSSSSTNNINSNNGIECVAATINSSNTAAVAATATAAAASIMSTPPDVVLEVGPAPSVRFVAHSIVLGMHSGYLRSAIRLDEGMSSIIGRHSHSQASPDLVLYLSNVTADQFAPLLTYMYTGYLDLNVENIFGVLLATHVLHMPRALEICRSFLARAQTEGYLANSLQTAGPSTATSSSTVPSATTNNTKIIRPIPSKATLPNFGFLSTAIPPTHQFSLPVVATDTEGGNSNSFKNLQHAYFTATPMLSGDETREREEQECTTPRNEDIDVDRNSSKAALTDSEDEEVFIDSNTESDDSEAEKEIDCTISVSSCSPLSKINKRQENKKEPARREDEECKEREIIMTIEPTTTKMPVVKQKEQHQQQLRSSSNHSTTKTATAMTILHKSTQNKRKKMRQKASTSGLQVAKAPIPASQLDTNEGSKVIIDVASCDGPVRFRRILNTAYGHKPEDFAVAPERTQQSVSLSFHQQMAKTISQQRQLVQHAEESENSESSSGGGSGGKHAHHAGGKNNTNNEIYICVYCKHTFKSQYCYQKHAKRHLNPLSLNCQSTSGASSSGGGEVCEKVTSSKHCSSGGGCGGIGGGVSTYNATGGGGGGGAYTRSHTHTLNLPPMVTSSSKQNTATELLRREVRPLDMNVQYYPCKTCGSKFPSYYFVHKHRKMCHADEEAVAAAAEVAAGSNARANNDSGASERGSAALAADIVENKGGTKH